MHWTKESHGSCSSSARTTLARVLGRYPVRGRFPTFVNLSRASCRVSSCVTGLTRIIPACCPDVHDSGHLRTDVDLLFLSRFEPLPFLRTSPWWQGTNPYLPRTRLSGILVSWIESALTHHVNSLSTTSINYFLMDAAFHEDRGSACLHLVYSL